MNKSLFSQHFLENRLAEQPDWQEEPLSVFEEVRKLWQKAKRLGANWNEAQTEDEFIKPVLALLQWHYISQATTTHGKQTNRPDYAFFADEASKNTAYSYSGQDDAFYSRVYVVAEAKRWERPLSKKDADGRNDAKGNSNPSHQMVAYLVSTRVAWGILTNGVIWRLYSREVSSVASEYYEIDLSPIFANLPKHQPPTAVQLDQFKRWWLFFRCAAFTPGAQGKSFVQRVHEGSTAYARRISDKLKEIVFEDVMPEIAGGFIAHRQQVAGVEQESDETLRQIYQASLSLLYKLLFLLYAEARNLLPMGNVGYHEQSLQVLAQWAAQKRDLQQPLSRSTSNNSTPKYAALLALFDRVDRGDPDLSIPRYNGGLFSPSNPDNQFLNRHRLSDFAVATAVDLLVRDKGEPVDYAYISVRNLGAIYEGLLENKLHVLDAANGKVELINDKGERKASGSYYTPDYIVGYIVQQTLDPILDERYARFALAMERCLDLRQQLQSPLAENSKNNQLLRRELEKVERQAREAFLGIKVCDPAMGSGHFLVNAVDHLTDGMIERLQSWHNAHSQVDLDWNPIYRLIEQVRRAILDEMAEQAIAVDASKLDDTALLTRLVMKRCVYGVDLNKMAVELAKLSLWLHSFTIGAPLSFLDHHLRWGNSLIGSDVRTVEAAIQQTSTGQFGLFAGPFAGLLDLTTVMLQIAEGSDATLADVRQSAEDFQSFQKALTPYKQVLDLWVSQYFGNKLALEFLTLTGDRALSSLRDNEPVSPYYQDTLAKSKALWNEKHFFHWDLEFPEVFVDLEHRDWAQNPGFDAVIGNPPYISTSDIDQQDRQYFRIWGRTSGKELNTFALFIESGLRFQKVLGYLSFIVPDSILNVESYIKLRQLILSETALSKIAHIKGGAFLDAVIGNNVVLVLKKEIAHNSSNVVSIDTLSTKDGKFVFVGMIPQDTYLRSKMISFHVNIQKFEFFEKLQSISRPLSELAVVRDGIKTGDNSRFLSHKKLNEQFKPVLSNADIERYGYDYSGIYVLYDTDKLARPRVESIFLADEKIIIRQTGDRVIAAMDRDKFYTLDNTHLVLNSDAPYSLLYLMVLLNSRLLDYAHQILAAEEDRTYAQVRISNLEQLPIRLITKSISTDINHTIYAEQSHKLYDQTCDNENPTPLLAFVAHHLSQQPAQSDVVHDLLAFLAEQMIALNQQKQSEIKGFLHWLQRQIGVEIDMLPGKTTLQNYLGDYQKGESERRLEELIAVLVKNKRKLNIDPVSRNFQEGLEREYEASLSKLLPLKQQLAFTDRLIDQIVYQLYGLSEEEIALVEGKQ